MKQIFYSLFFFLLIVCNTKIVKLYSSVNDHIRIIHHSHSCRCNAINIYKHKKNVSLTLHKSNKLQKCKKIIPKYEPLSRYGNPKSYKIYGHTYVVMKSSNGYKARGIASWYGSNFHNKKTSSGEYYNMYAMTAAHKTLPLPTYVKVKNLNSGTVVIVRVNDRGPFFKKRIIDLSYAAAEKLGLLNYGIAPVEIEAINFPQNKSIKKYYIQINTVYNKISTKTLFKKLKTFSNYNILRYNKTSNNIIKLGPYSKEIVNNIKNKLLKVKIYGKILAAYN